MVLPPKPPPEEPDKEPPKIPAEKLNPLVKHSLRGDAAKLHARAVDTVPLLGGIMFLGQATIIYAPPNAGKTLLVNRFIQDAIDEGRLDPNMLFYINADDSGKGLAEKVEILELQNAHVLAPGLKGFRVNQFVDKLIEATQDGTARGSVVIIDTLKKFTNLMDKARSSSFANVCREYVMAGGTIIALGHTAKNRNADGTLRYQGTTDILEDFDAAYVAEAIPGSAGASEKIVRFTQEKSRADSPQEVAYAYSTEHGLTYAEKLASVRPVYPEELESSLLVAEMLDDEKVIERIRGLICGGMASSGQDKLVRAVADDGDISRSQARRVLDRYTGTDPDKHRWSVQKGDRGKRTYSVLRKPQAEPGG
ncbi:AAA family ATPase [uncultured Brevundimonas sp.]|uniref:AAA family ATPase n=1 Tax=uncultured Brevundimonas sp. TaxID=213418 RepID=UPI0025FC620F|nr:AAA family ATPase [uncultured Brevundimonas sp.]